MVHSEMKSPMDFKLDRQGFVVVYNSQDKDSFKEAEKLLTDIQEKMAKPEVEGEEEPAGVDGEDPPEIPPHPIVVVATHTDCKKDKKVKNVVEAEAGSDMAASVGATFFEVNKRGKNVKKAFEACVTAIKKVEDNLVFDKEPTFMEKYCKCILKLWCCSFHH